MRMIRHTFDWKKSRAVTDTLKELKLLKMTRPEKRRLSKGWGYCTDPLCGKLRKLNDEGLCRACDPARVRADTRIDFREMKL